MNRLIRINIQKRIAIFDAHSIYFKDRFTGFRLKLGS